MVQDRADMTNPLGPYRALDLTEGGFNWCGKVLGDHGADVIKLEPPGGSRTRYRGPFYKDDPHPERSLFWYVYCINKRSMTLDIETADGQALFKQLAATADFIIESFPPGYMDSLGLGYDVLAPINPGLIMTSITPFGQTGPYAHYKVTDMLAWSIGGHHYSSGDDDRPPVRISFPQSELHAAAQAGAGTMAAFWHRQKTGQGQQVDVSMQTSVAWTLMNATNIPPLQRTNAERAGPNRVRDGFVIRSVFRCSDGYVIANVSGGGGFNGAMPGLVKWMDEDGVTPEFMKGRDWYQYFALEVAAEGDEGVKFYKAVEEELSDFFASKTKAELSERAAADRIHMAPCNTVEDIWQDPQLRDREFWLEVYHPEIDAMVTSLGPYIKMGESPIKIRRRAPLIGEHNHDIYAGELGLTEEAMAQLKTLGVI